MGNKVSVELTDKDEEQCFVIDGLSDLQNDQLEWRQQSTLIELAKKRVLMEHAQVVGQLKRQQQQQQQGNKTKDASSSFTSPSRASYSSSTSVDLSNDLSNLRKRVWKVMVVTPGSLFLGPAARKGAKKLLKASKNRWMVALDEIRLVVVVDEGNRLVWLMPDRNNATSADPILYQTPYYQDLPWLKAWALAHVGVPPWAINTQFQGFHPFPKNMIAMPTMELQLDGGLSYRWQAKLWHRLLSNDILEVRKKVSLSPFDLRDIILTVLRELQPSTDPLRETLYQRVDIPQLVQQVIAKLQCKKLSDKLRDLIKLDVLECLTFNLTVRTLTVKVQDDLGILLLARLLLYNVTLRTLNLTGSKFVTNTVSASSTAGKQPQDAKSQPISPCFMLGDALARNAQPLLSTLILDHCGLTKEDVEGLIPGLVRTWGSGGSSHPVFFSVQGNDKVPVETWDALWKALLKKQPNAPAPVLQFWQHLNVAGTTNKWKQNISQGTGLVDLLRNLTGLRHFEWDHHPNDRGQILQALAESKAPLQFMKGQSLEQVDYAVFPHAKTMQTLTLPDWQGDAGSLVGGWVTPVPQLTVKFETFSKMARCSPTGTENCPGTIVVNQSVMAEEVLKSLAKNATGLHTLELHHVDYVTLVTTGAITTLATGGFLKKLLLFQPPPPKINDGKVEQKQQFWYTLALSNTIEYLDVTNHFGNCRGEHELSMVGKFLKRNRSLRYLFIDSIHMKLDPEDVKVLRSAFYGNKKVVHMSYLENAQKTTMKHISDETKLSNQKIVQAKQDIKRIFKSHYSKYNYKWRDKPNRLKVPHVEIIRTEKRKIGRMNRGASKVGQLLQQTKSQISVNATNYQKERQEKAQMRLEKRKPQMQKLAEKKRKVFSTFIAKYHKARQNAAKNKSAKEQVSRSNYYRHRGAWPHSGMESTPNSHYHRYNDPYHMRYYGYYPYYVNHHHYYQNRYYDDVEVQEDGGVPPPYVLDCETPVEGAQESDSIMPHVSDYCSPNQDQIIEIMERDMASGISNPEYLTEMHLLMGEHGVDTLEATSGVMDSFSALDASISQIAESVGTDAQYVDGFISSVDPDPYSIDEALNELPEIEEIGIDDDAKYDAGIEEADEAVNMYAGAGPHNFPKGGPPGASVDYVQAGARRRAVTRKINRALLCQRRKVGPLQSYQTLSLLPQTKISQPILFPEQTEWPGCIASRWKNEVTSVQIQALSESHFSLPAVADLFDPEKISSWSELETEPENIEVCLVTQCSLDRLSNLESQLKGWQGCASVALFIKHHESSTEAKFRIDSLIRRVKSQVAVTIVEAISEQDAYPINYLRNVALLQAREEFIAASLDLNKTAVFLVDVDFVPSVNLHKVLHCPEAAASILDQENVIVVPAFEFDNHGQEMPQNCFELKEHIDRGAAEPFHISHFSQGHGPTRFDKFWEFSGQKQENPWREAYTVSYEKLYEPYIVLSTLNVPLYDERFQGYGLNKVSHLASVAHHTSHDLLVLPQVFVVAPCHDRSESYNEIYGKSSEHSESLDYAKLHLKALFHQFSKGGFKPTISDRTKVWNRSILANLAPPSLKVHGGDVSVHLTLSH